MTRIARLAAVAAALWVTSFGAWAQQGYGPYYGQHPHWGGGWFGMFLGPLMMILFIALAAVVVVLVVRWLGGGGHAGAAPPPAGRTSLDILKERFARGEIDAEEFEARRRLLGD